MFLTVYSLLKNTPNTSCWVENVMVHLVIATLTSYDVTLVALDGINLNRWTTNQFSGCTTAYLEKRKMKN